MLLPHHASQLKAAVGPRDEHGNFACVENDRLNALIKRIKEESPRHFHSDATLSERVFYHEPKQRIPNAGYIVPRKFDIVND